MLSICIPTYEMHGLGAEFLRESLDRLVLQKSGDFEIVVSDQSVDGNVRSVCEEYTDNLSIKYVRADAVGRSASANINNAFRHASGDIVKVLFQDDLIIDEDAVAKIQTAFSSSEGRWLLTGCMHTVDGVNFKRKFVPRYHQGIYLGRNTVSSPSVLALRRDGIKYFDESLIWLMDVDYYKQCHDAFGQPIIIAEPLIANRLHPGQVSEGVGKKVMIDELRRVRVKYLKSESIGLKIDYWKELLRLARLSSKS